MPRRDSRNHARFWTPPGIAGLSLMRAEFTTQEFAPHWHEALVVGVTETGGAEVRSRGEVQQVGHIIQRPPSISSVAPVMYSLAGSQRNKMPSAISSEVPSRPRGMCRARDGSATKPPGSSRRWAKG